MGSMEQRQPADVLEFAAGLGIELYPWQADVNLTIAEAVTKKRINIAVRAPNEAGKTSRVVAVSVLWHLVRFRVSLGHQAAEEADQMSYDGLTELRNWEACAYKLQRFRNWNR